jgi:hypothetical protein
MYEFPLLEVDTIIEPTKVKEEIKIQLHFDVADEPIATYKHVLSHQQIYATFWKLNSTTNLANTIYIKCSQKELEGFAIPRLIDRFLEEHG